MSKNPFILRLLLYPLSKLYGAVVYIRNKLFDMGVLRQHEFDIPIITVGNISAGGTGKTPHVEYLVEMLSNDYSIGVISRGYKRKTRGFVLADKNSTPLDIGDEPYQIYNKFSRRIPVAVCESRVRGINELLARCPEVNLIVLDDAFQHRYVKPAASIVVSEYARPVYADHLLPYGRLRESKSALQRAEMVLVSKCPDDLPPRDIMLYKANLDLFPFQKVYFTNFEYGQLVPVFPDATKPGVPQLRWLTSSDMVLAVAGIGNPKPFIKYIKRHDARVWVNIFPDHHNFTDDDMQLLLKRYNDMKGVRKIVVTTEKDAVRMANHPNFPDALKPYVYFVPVRVNVLRDESDDMITELGKIIRRHIAERRAKAQ